MTATRTCSRMIFGCQSGSTRPKFLELRSSKVFIMFVVSFAAFTDIFLYSLIVPVTPTALEERVGLAKGEIQAWTSTLLALYAAALLAFSPISGYLADRFESRRWPLLIGLIALGAATALLCIGTSIGFWIAGRLCQGAAAAVVWTVGVALMADTVGKEGLGQAIGYISLTISIAILVGPLLGGVLYQHGGYYSVYGLAFGFIAFDIFLRLVLIEKKHAKMWLEAKEEKPVALEKQAGQEEICSSVPDQSPALEDGQRTQNSVSASPRPFGRLAILLSSNRLLVSLWGYFIVALTLTSFDSVLPLFVQQTFGWKQSGQGLAFLSLMLPNLIDPLTGYIIDRYPRSTRYLTAGGFLCSVPALVLLRLVTNDSMHDKVLLCALLALLGFCVGIAMPPLVAEVFLAVKEKEDVSTDIFGRGGATALAFGLSNMGFAAGNLIGPFFAGFIRKDAGWGTMGWAMALIVGLSALPTFLFVGGWILEKPQLTPKGREEIA